MAVNERARSPAPLRPLCIVWALLSLAAVVAALGAMSIDRAPLAEAGRANLQALRPWWLASGSAWTALTGLWWTLRGTRDPGAGGRGALAAAAIVLLVALAARAAVLLVHQPALSDDVERYVFDGRNAAAGVNPYSVTPDERIGLGPESERWPGEGRVAARVNNPEMATIYLPVSQWAFAAAALAAPHGGEDPDRSALADRALFTIAELVAIGLLLAWLRRRGRSPWWVALYAWHPLAISEIAGSGHQDALGLALLLACLLLADRRPDRTALWTIPLALAALVKPIVLPVAAVLLRHRSWRSWAASLAVGAAICAAASAPLLLLRGGDGLANLGATASRFSLKWSHFGSVYGPLLALFERAAPAWGNDPREQAARVICLALLVLVVAAAWWRSRDVAATCSTIFLAMVLLSPAAHPWYLLWALVLLPAARDPAVWIASLTLPWGYWVLADPVGWTVPAWLPAAAYVPVYLVLLARVFFLPSSPEPPCPSRPS